MIGIVSLHHRRRRRYPVPNHSSRFHQLYQYIVRGSEIVEKTSWSV
jgi:hypothetical protein